MVIAKVKLGVEDLKGDFGVLITLITHTHVSGLGQINYLFN